MGMYGWTGKIRREMARMAILRYDFCQELVRDTINTKTGKDDVLPDDWERRRARRPEKLVDTKASKGRKL